MGILFGIPAGARAAAPAEDEVVFGGTYTLANGQTLDGNLIVFGGTVVLEEGSHVQGDVSVYGGSISIDGTVDEDVFISGGMLTLTENAEIGGDVRWVGGTFEQDEAATIDGEILNVPSPLTRPDVENSFAGRLGRWILDALWSIFLWFAFSALAVLVVIFFPNPTGRVTQTLVAQPGQSALVGLLTLIVAVPVLLILAITIILIPVSFVGVLA
ncbi:MAG TPA: polymer-forming cytoskeletal protein, partial [Anaerolineales bacterium]|nr:polymer-forming cytoskeletal protein [Anaerolineales bacterium]